MSKKSKRNKAKKRNLDQRAKSRVGLQAEKTPAFSSTEKKVVEVSSESSKYQVLSQRYQYVLPELKVIGVISGIIFIVLIALSFVLG